MMKSRKMYYRSNLNTASVVKVRRNAPELSSGTYHLSTLEFRHLRFLEIEFRH